MIFSPAIKCRSVLLCFCIVAAPLYSQVQDTIQRRQIQSIEQTVPVQPGNTPAALYPPARQIPPAQQRPIDTMGMKSSTHEEGYDYAEYVAGKMDGTMGAKGKPLWILAGLSGTGLCICFGVAGIGVAFAMPSSPSEEAFMGKSSLYIQGYNDGYRTKIRFRNAGWATLGCAIALVIDIVFDFTSSFGNLYVEMD